MTITQKLTLKNLRLNKTRTVVTIIGIMLSVALITVVAGIATSFQKSLLDYEIYNTGDYDFKVSAPQTEAGIKKLEGSPLVRDVYTMTTQAIAQCEDVKSMNSPYVSIQALSPNMFRSGFSCVLKEGRYPEKNDELALSPEFMKATKNKYKVGDEITLDLGIRMRLEKDEKGNTIDAEELGESYYYLDDQEEFRKKLTRTYKITGILEDMSGELRTEYYGGCIRLYTTDKLNSEPLYELFKYDNTYVRFTDEAEKDYKHSLGTLMGLSMEDVDKYFGATEVSSNEMLDIGRKIAMSGINFENMEIHYRMLTMKGIGMDPQAVLMITLILGFVLLVVIASSVFIIRNSFAISITEKTKLYGMLASMGATRRQIRKNVYFEGLILGLIGIPLGLLLGVGGTAALVATVNNVLKEDLGSMRFVLSVPLLAVCAAIVLGALTIFLSVLSSAQRAARISPIEAIRSSTDIKISGKKKNKNKTYKTPGIILSLFHAGGSIAWKNMKRSKKQYRTTVISIVVSVAVYITAFSFVQYGYQSLSGYLEGSEYNMTAKLYAFTESGRTEISELEKRYDKILHTEGVEKGMVVYEGFEVGLDVPTSVLTDEYLEATTEPGAEIPEERTEYLNLVALDDQTFNRLVRETGADVGDGKFKAFIYNTYRVDMPGLSKTIKQFKETKDVELKGVIEYEDYSEFGDDYEAIPEDYEPKVIKRNLDFKTVGEAPKSFRFSVMNNYHYKSVLVINMDTFKAIDGEEKILFFNSEASFYAEDAETVETTLTDLRDSDNDFSDMWVQNYAKVIRSMNNTILIVQIFVYGFILVIALIGITNIFNTITTNMNLRRKEFAMLQSIGMTKGEFNRMISLESLLYTGKSLLIGLPLGIGGSVLIHFLFKGLSVQEMAYMFPWTAVLLSVLVVLMLVWVIMRFSIRKVRKQNIIETIRNDNI